MKAPSTLATAYSPSLSHPELQAHQKAPRSPADVLEFSLPAIFEHPFHTFFCQDPTHLLRCSILKWLYFYETALIFSKGLMPFFSLPG